MYLRKSFVIILLVGLLLASCGGQETTETPISEMDAFLTAGVGTLAASIFQTQTALVPTNTETPVTTVSPTNTFLPAITLPPLSSPTLGLLSTRWCLLVHQLQLALNIPQHQTHPHCRMDVITRL